MAKEWVGNIDPSSGLPVALEQAAREIIGAAIKVHRHLGPGLLESVYERALIHELNLCGYKVKVQVPVTVAYKGVQITGQRLDLLVDPPGIVIELKSVEKLLVLHERQLLSYLRSGGYQLGLLMNFNVQMMKQGIKRVVNSRHRPGQAGGE